MEMIDNFIYASKACVEKGLLMYSV